MKIICYCGAEMDINQWEPDQIEIFAGFDCPVCQASFYGKIKPGKEPYKDLVLLAGATELTEEDVKTIMDATWWETHNGFLLVSATQINHLIDDNPLDCGLLTSKNLENLTEIPHVLKRFNPDDGFYHA